MNEQYLNFKKAFHTLSFPERIPIPSNIQYSKWVKMISAGFIIYSSYCYFKRTPSSSNRFHFLKTLFSWTLKKNSKNNKICNANIELQVKEIPEHVKYDGGWYAEFDELKQSESDNVVTVTVALEPIRETTPRGDIIMCYDADNKSFNYYSNNKNIPYSTLDAVARKYVCLHKVPSIYVDIRDEIQKGHEKNIKKEKKLKASSSSSSSSSSTSSIVKKKLFAVFKNYKTGSSAAAAPASLDLKNPKSIINKNETDVGKEIVLKENVNKFIYKGLVEEYDADLKLKQLKLQQEYNEKSNTDSSNNECNVDNCEKGANKNISYADFKNKHKINQN
jgi:hypothetical protein